MRAPVLAGALVGLALLVPAVAGPDPASAGSSAPSEPRPATASWSEPVPVVAAGASTALTVEPGDAASFEVVVSGGLLPRLPDGCRTTGVARRASWLSVDGRRLTCVVTPGSTAVPVPVRVAGRTGEELTAQVVVGGEQLAPPSRSVVGEAAPDDVRRLRLLSSPDFLNADVGDLRRGPGSWSGRTENSTSKRYEAALAGVLDDWKRADPAAVLVAGDLVEGHWGVDPTGSGNFGPVDGQRQRRAALHRAATTYYPQWLERFTSRGLDVRPAMGDHEYGDNPWQPGKLDRAPDFERAFARWFGRRPNGSPRYADRPRRSPHELTAYAWRPHPEVQVVTLNVFDMSGTEARLRVDPAQLRWLRSVLRRANADGVGWTIVQGHTPVLGPVRSNASSALHYEGGARSPLWRTFVEHGVDLYLTGEVHEVTASERDGIAQVAHGGLFQYGLTNYLLIDVHDDRVELTLRDYAASWRHAPDGSRLWQTRVAGMPKLLTVDPRPYVVGTAVLREGQGLTEESGLLRPVVPSL